MTGRLPASVVVIGTGMVGTSVALALRRRKVTVWLSDADPAAVAEAVAIGAGTPLASGPQELPPGGVADLAVLAVPPAAVAGALRAAQRSGLARWYTDVASVKELPIAQARELGCDLTAFVPGHPLAGSERSGPSAARGDLFVGRAWALCAAEETAATGVEVVAAVATACGAQPARMSAADHDRWAALVSHAPHLAAAAMAARLEEMHESERDAALAMAGPGLRDVTRVAAGDPGLWEQILAANAAHTGKVLAALADELSAAADALAAVAAGDDTALKRISSLLERGGAGVARIPGKHGRPAPAYTAVQVLIGDQPGELARLFQAAAAAGINIEDMRIEHAEGVQAGVAELSVRPEAAVRLTEALAAAGWPVRG
jgi:prephenate dehydrogenase